jgi:hypothetical protein
MQQIKDLLPQALQGNEARVLIETKQPLSIEAKNFETALQEKKIWHSTEEEMKQALRYIYMLVGLRAINYPDGLEKQLLHAYIFEDYGGHTPAELRLAFKMAIQNKLSLRPEDVICYENFSIAYFTRIMEAYREWAREQVKQLPDSIEQKRELTVEEKIQIDCDYAYYCWTQINKLPVKK